MPKTVDHEARREQLAEAVLTVIQRSGLERVTLREVAREVGWTSGVLLHYFRDKEELVTFAFELATRRAGRRVDERLPGLRGLAALRAFMEETLPISENARFDAEIWQTFEGHAVALPGVGAQQRYQYQFLQERLAGMVREAQALDEIAPEVDAARAGLSITATIVGLRTMALINPTLYTAEHLMAVADDVLARLAAQSLPQPLP